MSLHTSTHTHSSTQSAELNPIQPIWVELETTEDRSVVHPWSWGVENYGRTLVWKFSGDVLTRGQGGATVTAGEGGHLGNTRSKWIKMTGLASSYTCCVQSKHLQAFQTLNEIMWWKKSGVLRRLG